MSEKDNDGFKYIPQSSMELELALTEPVWGKEVPAGLKSALTEQGEVFKGEDGKIYVRKKALWDLLGMYTRDLRLGNLTRKDIHYCKQFLDFAQECLMHNYTKTFFSCMAEVISLIELSQSHKGFLRIKGRTIRKESYEESSADEKSSWFGGRKKREDE